MTVAAYYPSITLSVVWSARSQSVGPAVTAQPLWSDGLFDGGARDAVKAQVVAAYDQTVAAYRQTVLTAIGEVEDNPLRSASSPRNWRCSNRSKRPGRNHGPSR